jgi:hypothetical protein
MANASLVKDVEARKSRGWFLFFPLGSTPKYQDIMDDCLREGSGDFMVNVRMYKKVWTILLFSGETAIVKGDVGNSMGRSAMPRSSME